MFLVENRRCAVQRARERKEDILGRNERGMSRVENAGASTDEHYCRIERCRAIVRRGFCNLLSKGREKSFWAREMGGLGGGGTLLSPRY